MKSLKELLLEHGLNDMEAGIWCRFISTAVGALREAHARLVGPHRWEEFTAKAGALAKTRSKRKADHGKMIPAENGVTDDLSHILTRLTKSKPAEHPIKQMRICFFPQPPIELPSQTGSNARRGDFRAVSFDGEDAPELVFETKVLEHEGDLDASYFAAGGMGCFTGALDGKEPYTDGPFGAMLAYALSADEKWWLERIFARFPGQPPTLPHCTKVLIEGEKEPCLCSKHERPVRNDLVSLFHFVMLFDPCFSPQI